MKILVCYQKELAKQFKMVQVGLNLLGNFSTDKGINRDGEVTVRAGYGNKKGQKTTAKRQYYENKTDF